MKLSLRTQLMGVVILSFLGSALFGTLAFRTLDELRIGSPTYHEITRTKDLIADVLPPPAYLVEPYLLVHEMKEETDHARLLALVRRSRELHAEYDACYARWSRDLPQGALRTALLETSHRPATEFLRMVDQEFVPALLSGNRARAEALDEGPLRALYIEHRAAVDQVVTLAPRGRSPTSWPRPPKSASAASPCS